MKAVGLVKTTGLLGFRCKSDDGGGEFLRHKRDKNYDTGSRAELMARSKNLGMELHCYEKALMR